MPLAGGLNVAGCPKPISYSRLLVVEGQTTFLFILDLLRHLRLDRLVEVRNSGGNDELRDYLETLCAMSTFADVVSMGIIRDAESNAASAFDAVCHALDANRLPVPRRMAEAVQGKPNVSVFILPDCANPGMVETLCLRSVADDPGMTCVDAYLRCLDARGISVRPTKVDKTRAHAFLASRPNPELLVAQAAREGYWPWESPAFDALKQFLTSL